MPSPLEHILKSPSLPSLPTVAVQLLDLSRDSSASQHDFVRVTQSDPAIAAKILQLSNSSFFGIRNEVTTIQRAISMLGTRSITSLALSFSIARQSTGEGDASKHFHEFWQRSVLQAMACEAMVDYQEEHSRAELFLAGLMLDIGRLAMLKVLGRKYVDILNVLGAQSAPLLEQEQEKFGFNHAEAGEALLKHWSFPPSLIKAVTHHHDAEVPKVEERELQETLRLTRVASAIGEYFYGPATGEAREEYFAIARRVLKIDETTALDLIDNISDHFREAADLFNADAYDLPDPSDLMAAANRQLSALAMEAEKSQASLAGEVEALRHQAIHDPLTAVYNRAYFDDVFTQEADLCRRSGRSIGVIMFDVDHFKTFNDTYGHQFGDVVLTRLAEVVAGKLRESDVLARYGGEEFIVLARQPTEVGLRMLAERLRESVEDAIFEHEGKTVSVTVSVGAAHLAPKGDEQQITKRLIKEADEAMYDAKRGGRNLMSFRSLSNESDVILNQQVEESLFSSCLVRDGAVSREDIAKLEDQFRPATQRIGELAVCCGLLTTSQVEDLLEKQRGERGRRRFGEVAIETKLLSERSVEKLLAVQSEDPGETARLLTAKGLVAPDELAGRVDAYWRALSTVEPPVSAVSQES